MENDRKIFTPSHLQAFEANEINSLACRILSPWKSWRSLLGSPLCSLRPGNISRPIEDPPPVRWKASSESVWGVWRAERPCSFQHSRTGMLKKVWKMSNGRICWHLKSGEVEGWGNWFLAGGGLRANNDLKDQRAAVAGDAMQWNQWTSLAEFHTVLQYGLLVGWEQLGQAHHNLTSEMCRSHCIPQRENPSHSPCHPAPVSSPCNIEEVKTEKVFGTCDVCHLLGAIWRETPTTLVLLEIQIAYFFYAPCPYTIMTPPCPKFLVSIVCCGLLCEGATRET